MHSDDEQSEEYSFCPIHNPFTNPESENENFPSISTFLDTSVAHDHDASHDNTMDASESHISLNFSIDTLAKVKPVDISVTEFLEHKELEEHIEDSNRDVVEHEDLTYFKNR
jgi:hypothetical protein